MLRDADDQDALWRLQTVKTEIGWKVTYRGTDGVCQHVAEIVWNGRECTVWLEGDALSITCDDFDSSIDCIGESVQARERGPS